jgi:hypothetical protein
MPRPNPDLNPTKHLWATFGRLATVLKPSLTALADEDICIKYVNQDTRYSYCVFSPFFFSPKIVQQHARKLPKKNPQIT